MANLLKVLLIEDNPGDADLIIDLLDDMGAAISTSVNKGIELIHADRFYKGLDFIKTGDIDLVLLDLSLPDEPAQGLDLLALLMSKTTDLPIVILTGLDDKDLAIKAVHNGAQDYLVKRQLEGLLLEKTIRYAVERHTILKKLESQAKELREVSEKLQVSNKYLEKLSIVDPLTNLINRRGLHQALMHELGVSRREMHNLHAILVDLDDFKYVNDNFGHAAGDAVLIEVAKRLKATARTTDYISRIGGDEFILLLPKIIKSEVAQVAEKFRMTVSSSPIMLLSGKSHKITASLGMVPVSINISSVNELLALATQVLHNSKKEGKDRVAFENSVVNNGFPDIVSDPGRSDKLYAVRQPIFSVSDMKIVGYEFLCRSRIEGFEMPDDFFRVSRAINNTNLVDHNCLRMCIAATGSIPLNITSHINILPSTLIDTPTEHLIVDFMENGKVKRPYCLEISEQQIIGDSQRLVKPVKAFKKAGIKIAIDNVGFGNSCLETLILLEPEIIKIDKDYIQGISKSIFMTRALKRLLRVAETLDAEVIVLQGVETQDDLDACKDVGVKYVQGYVFGKPERIP